MSKASILIVEDEGDIRELIRFNLEREGYKVLCAENAEVGFDLMRRFAADLVLMDMMLPGMDGFEALKRIRANPASATLPVIMVTARGEDADIVAGLELGADDYVCKPFSPRVLVARVRARLRETGKEQASEGEAGILSSGGVRLDGSRHEALVNGNRVDLSATEFALLEFLMANPGHVFSRQRIIAALRGPDYPVTDRAVDVQVLGLRRKLGTAGDRLETIRGVGYRWREDP